MEKLIKLVFTLGFMISREGFNGECGYEHCCDGLKADHQTEDEFFQHIEGNEAFQECLTEVINRFKNKDK